MRRCEGWLIEFRRVESGDRRVDGGMGGSECWSRERRIDMFLSSRRGESSVFG